MALGYPGWLSGGLRRRGGGDDSDNGGGEVIVDEPDGGEVWSITRRARGIKKKTVPLWVFNENGTFEKKRAGESLDDANISGDVHCQRRTAARPVHEPGVGTGALRRYTADDTFFMDFIEYWHTHRRLCLASASTIA